MSLPQQLHQWVALINDKYQNSHKSLITLVPGAGVEPAHP